jgi:hypothetical protein
MSNPTWLWAIVGGATYDLTGAGILYQEHGDGFGLPPHHRFTHGATNRDFRLDPRPLTLIAGFARLCEADVYAARRMLLDIFKPSNTPITLRWDLSDGTVRQIDVFYEGSMTLPLRAPTAGGIRSSNQSGQTPIGQSGGVYQRTAIDLIAEDPTFYDPTLQVATVTNGYAAGGLTVPLPVPFSIGPSVFSGSTVIQYAGDWLAYPVLRLNGPLTSPVIRNTTTGEILDFTGATIDAGDYWDIDLGYGAKTIVDSFGTSQIAALVNGSDLGTFHLAAASDARSSFANTITLTATTTTSVSSMRVSWYSRFVGF